MKAVRSGAGALAALLGAAALPALAQQAGDRPAQLESIIVTGTHAKDRTELNSTAPVDILGAEDLRAVAGPEANLGQALQSLLPSFNYLDQSNSGSADHVRVAQLRGLNPDQILVLINGKRVHTTSIFSTESAVGVGSVAVDFASIPVNAIKRVEVLRDGAGAQYGSDAIAGVINVILDDAPTGGAVEVSAGQYRTHFDPTNQDIRDGATFNVQGKYGIALGDGGFVRFGVDATHHNPTNRAGFDQFYATYPSQNVVSFRVGDAEIKNLNLWANSALPLDGGATAYGSFLYNHRKSDGDAFFRESYDNVNNVAAIYPNGFLPHSQGTNEDWHVSGGVRGHAGFADVDASITYGLNTFRYGLDNSLNASLGPTSPTSFDLGSFRFGQTTFNLDFTNDVAIAGTPLTMAYGLEARQERFSDTAGDPASYIQGTYPGDGAGNGTQTNGPPASGSQGDGGLNPADVSSNTRTISGLYADLSGNLAPSFFADAGARFDHYSDAGSSTTGKLSARWEFAPRLALRGAVSNNFRAPALAQVWSSYSPTTYVSSGTLGGVQIVPVSSAPAQSLGAQPLKPEKSRNISLGITAQPVSSVQLSADFFRIAINDRIALSQNLSPATGPYAGNTYEFFTNAVDTTTRGAEIVASWTTRTLGQNLRISDASMWANNQINNIHAQPPQINALGNGLIFGLQAQNAITTAIPKRRDVVSFNWYADGGRANSWNLLARVTHTGEVTRVFDFSSFGGGIPTQTYGATVQLDLEAEYRILRDLAVAVGSQNLTNRYPTQSDSSINYGGNLPYDFLSPIGFNGRYVYARLRYDLR
jgi:iron complex outermembrane recepter protein